mgnify:CR=1
MSHFAQYLRLAPILILEIRKVFLRLELSPSLTLDKLKRFETGSGEWSFGTFTAG